MVLTGANARSIRHCEERSDEAISVESRLLPCARNDSNRP